jgi:outer membrane protein
MKKVSIALMGIIIILLGVPHRALATDSLKIGYVDLSKAFDEYEKTKDSDRELEKKGDKKQSERDKTVAEIKRLKEGFELLSEQGKEDRQQLIDEKIRELQDFDREVRAELRRERDTMAREILKEIDKVIREYAEEKGYHLILNDRILLYGDPEFDITDEILKTLNSEYLKE